MPQGKRENVRFEFKRDGFDRPVFVLNNVDNKAVNW